GEERAKAVPVHGEQIDAGDTPGRGHPRAVTHQCHLPETLARSETRQDPLVLAGLFLDHLHDAVDDDIEPIAAVALAEAGLVRLEVLSAESRSFFGLELDDVGWQHQIEEPVRRDPELAVEAWHLHQIDRAP